MQKGKIIFLNGVSSSGKTTLARKLQERLTEPFYWLAVDTFVIDMMPKKFFSVDGFNPDGGEPVIFKTVSLAHHTIKFFSDMGINTIVEHFFFRLLKISHTKIRWWNVLSCSMIILLCSFMLLVRWKNCSAGKKIAVIVILDGLKSSYRI